MSVTLERRFTLKNKLGLHMRPAVALANQANQFQSRVRIIKNGRTADGKSIMSLLCLEANRGSELVVQVEGDDADQAMVALAALFDSAFGEALKEDP